MATAEHAFVLRLTKPRFEALQRRATRLDGGDNGTMSSHRWCPSAKERKTPPDLPPEAALEVRLHEIILHNERTLYLVTDLPDDVERLADLDPRRVEIEADIRNLKAVLNAETIRARKVARPCTGEMDAASDVRVTVVPSLRRRDACRRSDKPTVGERMPEQSVRQIPPCEVSLPERTARLDRARVA